MPTLETATANFIRLADQADDPATPASGYAAFYSKGDAPYFKNDAGTEVSLTPGASDTTGWVAASSAWSYASADAPTFVITTASDERGSIGIGMRIKLTQTTDKFFIVTAIGASTITVYGGTDYTLANAAITSPYFSTHKTPLGFPTNPTKWSVVVTDTTQRSQASPTQNTWYNLGSVTISVPIGEWRVMYKVIHQAQINGALVSVDTTLSTANNSESDIETTTRTQTSAGTSTTFNAFASVSVEKYLALTSKTAYYLNTRTVTASVATIYNRNEIGTLVIRAVCAYL